MKSIGSLEWAQIGESMSFFHQVPEGKPDAIFGLTGAFQADVRPQKVNLMVGIYRNEKLQPEMMPSVKRAKREILEQDEVGDYLSIDGSPDFLEGIGSLAFGEEAWKANHSRVYAAQTVGGTSALRVGAEFLFQEVGKNICLPQPTWPNHQQIFQRAGCSLETYSYYDKSRHGLDFNALCADLKRLPEKTTVVLHACCHNPSGCDPSSAEWREISHILHERRLLPFFDFAYQGLGDGLEKDREAIRIFLEEGHEMLIAYSCSKNFSLYCQRVGALFVVDENAAVKLRVGSQIKRIVRALYSNPPAHGARVVAHLLKSAELGREWTQELEGMRQRIAAMRVSLVERLNAKAKRGHFDYLLGHKGMFSFIDLNKAQVQKMIERFAVYMIDNGRISVAGLNKENLDYVVDSLLAVCE